MPGNTERPEPNYDPFTPGQNRRATVTEVGVEDMGNILRRAFVGRDVKFTIYCDEGPTSAAITRLPRR